MKRLILALVLCAVQGWGAKSFITCGKGTGSLGAGSTVYAGVWSGGNCLAATTPTTESLVTFPVSEAGTFSQLQAGIFANDRTSGSSITLRTGSGTPPTMSDSALTVSIGAASGAGRFVDSTHSVHVNAGDSISLKVVGGTGGTTFSLLWFSVAFVPDDYTKTWMKYGGYGSNVFSSVGTMYRQGIGGIPNTNSARVEADQQHKFKTGGTWKNLCINVSANSLGNNSTIRSRVNGANGSQTGTLSGGSTTQTCASGSDTIATDDLASWELTVGVSGGGSLTWESWASDFVSTTDATSFITGSTNGGTNLLANNTNYGFFHGSFGFTSAQGQDVKDPLYSMTLSNFGVYAAANSLTANCTFEIWKNNASTGVIVTFTSGQTGWQEDNTHTVNIVSGDLIEIKEVGSPTGTSITVTQLAMKATMAATPPPPFSGRRMRVVIQ